MREARIRRDVIAGELAALRLPEVHRTAQATRQTLRAEAERWRESRVDVSTGTMQTYEVAIARLLARLGDVPIETIDAPRVA